MAVIITLFGISTYKLGIIKGRSDFTIYSQAADNFFSGFDHYKGDYNYPFYYPLSSLFFFQLFNLITQNLFV